MNQQRQWWRVWQAVLVTGFLGLAGCGGAPDSTPAVGAPVTAQQATPEVVDGFAVTAVSTRTDDSQPRLTLRFSEPLASAQNFDSLISVTDAEGKAVSGGWSLQEDPRLLSFSGVEAEKKYRVAVKVDLLNDRGDKLKASFEEEVATVEAPPSVGFASKGSVLPARNTEGLPVVAVNVDDVNVEFYRVRDDQLGLVMRNYALSGRNWGWDLRRLGQYAELVYANHFALPGTRNQRGVWYLPIQDIAELKSPGLYFAVLRKAGGFDDAYEVTHYVVSDLGLHLRSYQGKVEVLTRSLLSGEAQSGVALSVLDQNGRTVLEGSSSSEGRASFDYTPDAGHLLVARRGGDLTLLPMSQPALDLSEFEVTGATADQVSVFIWSGRDLYRPGENLRFSALLRDFDGKPLASAGKLYATLRQPDGRAHAQAELEPGALGYYSYQRVMGRDVPTGKWSFELATDAGANARKHRFGFRIEEFLPERMKLDLDSPQERLAPGDALALEVDAAYLYGAPAAGNRFTGKLVLSVPQTLVPELKGYKFGDLANPPKGEPVDLVDQALDAEGKLATTVPIGLEQVPGPIAATLIGSLFETGGRPVTRTLTRVVWPAPQLVGLRPLFEADTADYGGNAGFEIVKVDASGNRQTGQVEARLIRMDREYHWSYDSDLGWKADFTETPREVQKQSITLNAAGPAKLELPVEWGAYRLEITDPDSKLVTRYPFEAGWGWEDNKGLDPRPDKVKLALDKAAYKAGDTLTLTVTPPHEGEAQLLVEAGTLLTTQAFTARRGGTVTLTVTPEWERHDVYITALVFRPGSAQDKTTPSRAVGIIHVPMDRQARKLDVAIAAAAQVEPSQPLSVTVKAPQLKGQQAFVTVSAVDVGVTNITSFPVPDPFLSFFAKRAYAVDARDIYGRIIEALAGDRAKLRFGGDAALKALASAGRPNARVQIVDLFAAPVQLDAAGHAVVRLDVPDFNGTLRLSTVVYGADRFGSASSETVVRAPVVAEVGMPRVLAADDRGQLALDVSNFTGKPGTFEARFSGNAWVSIDPVSQKLQLADQAKGSLRFTLRGGAGQGVGVVSLVVSGGGREITRQFEIAVRPAYPQTRTSRFEVLDPAQRQVDLSIDFGNWAPGSVRSRVALSNRAPLPIAAASKDLLDYPYGCIEQTTSRLYPYLLLDPQTVDRLGLKALDAEQRGKNVAFGLDRIASMQLSSGHFSYWPGDGYSDPALTPYVSDVLLDAQAAGFALPPNVLQPALERIKEDLLAGGEVSWERHSSESGTHARFAYSAYAGYVLSRVNQAPLSALRNLYDSERSKSLSGLPLMQLAVALKAAGDNERAQGAAREALADKWTRTVKWLSDYGSESSDQARMLALALEHELLSKDHDDRLLELSRRMASQNYRTTQENMAVLRLAKAMAKTTPQPLAGALLVADIEEGFRTGGDFSRDLTAPDLRAGARLRIDAPGTLYLSQDNVGVPLQAPAPLSQGLDIDRRYFRMDGQSYDGAALKEGEMLIVRLSVKASENLSDVLVTDLLPAGLEIENLNLLDLSQLEGITIEGQTLKEAKDNVTLRFEEFRDDRYVAALSNTYSEVLLTYLVRAVTPGDYSNPVPLAEDMYRPEVRSIGRNVQPRFVVQGR